MTLLHAVQMIVGIAGTALTDSLTHRKLALKFNIRAQSNEMYLKLLVHETMVAVNCLYGFDLVK